MPLKLTQLGPIGSKLRCFAAKRVVKFEIRASCTSKITAACGLAAATLEGIILSYLKGVIGLPEESIEAWGIFIFVVNNYEPTYF